VAAIHRQMRAGAGHRRARATRRARGTWSAENEARYNREQGADVVVGVRRPRSPPTIPAAPRARRRLDDGPGGLVQFAEPGAESDDGPVRFIGGFQDPRLGEMEYDVPAERSALAAPVARRG
jgi:hypothetical protein